MPLNTIITYIPREAKTIGVRGVPERVKALAARRKAHEDKVGKSRALKAARDEALAQAGLPGAGFAYARTIVCKCISISPKSQRIYENQQKIHIKC